VSAEKQPSGAATREVNSRPCGLPVTISDEFSYGPLRARAFDQGEWWIDRDGKSQRVADLRLDELLRLIESLTDNAERYYVGAFQLRSFTILGEAVLGRPGAELLAASLGDRLDALTPHEWLEATTLMRSLRTQVASRRENNA
jgi:hypothetical protein